MSKSLIHSIRLSKSKNAEALVADVRQKIERAKAEMQAAIEKVRLIDRGEQ